METRDSETRLNTTKNIKTRSKVILEARKDDNKTLENNHNSQTTRNGRNNNASLEQEIQQAVQNELDQIEENTLNKQEPEENIKDTAKDDIDDEYNNYNIQLYNNNFLDDNNLINSYDQNEEYEEDEWQKTDDDYNSYQDNIDYKEMLGNDDDDDDNNNDSDDDDGANFRDKDKELRDAFKKKLSQNTVGAIEEDEEEVEGIIDILKSKKVKNSNKSLDLKKFRNIIKDKVRERTH